MGDPRRVFLTSPFVQLETTPKAVYYRQELEQAFYDRYFGDPAILWANDLSAIYRLAKQEAEDCGLGAMDALHIAAAHLLDAHEFITAEKPGKSIYRARLVRVLYLYDLSGYAANL